MSIELRHLHCFIVLAEELHFGHAAKRLHITQPPLSTCIRQLEAFIGAALFIRDTKQVRLTSVGKGFLPEAIRALAQARLTVETGRALAAGRFGCLDIAFTSAMLFRGMSEILHTYASRHSNVTVLLSDMLVADQKERIKQGRLQCGFCPGERLDPMLKGRALTADKYICCVHESHWASERTEIDLTELADEDFIILSRDETLLGYKTAMSIFRRHNFEPKEKVHVRQWTTVVLMVASRFGVAVVPSSLQNFSINGVRYIPIAGEQSRIGGHFMWNPDLTSPALENLIQVVDEHIQLGKKIRNTAR